MPFSILIFMLGGFFPFSLSGMRQSIGVVIALYALKFLKANRWLMFIVVIIIASLFHSSSLIFILFYFIRKIKLNPYYVSISLILVFLFSKTIINIIASISEMLGIYSNYFNGEFNNGEFGRLLIVLVLLIMLLVCVSYAYLGKTKFYQFNTEINMHYFACAVVAMISVVPTPSRLLFLFIPVYITLVPNLICEYKDWETRTVVKIFFVLFFILFTYQSVFVQDTYGILPYHDVFNLF